MLLSRTPLRITLGGGGSDLLPNGRCVNAAVNLYTYIAMNHNFAGDYSLKYSEVERSDTLEGLKHPLFRQCLEVAHTPPGTEMTSMSDVPGGTGLGSSGAFTVGTLRVLLPEAQRETIARLATEIDVGKQDQYAAAYGGLRVWDFGEQVSSTVLELPDGFEFVLYDTGLRRDAYETLQANPRPEPAVLLADALLMEQALRDGDMERIARLLTGQWASKLKAAPTDAHLIVDRQINEILAAGAWGAKLVGAGDGGMILAYSPEPLNVPYRSIPIRVDHEGTTLL